MTKADLIREVSQQTGIERAIVAQVIEGVMEGIKSSLIGGEEVYLRGFGSFILKKRAAKTARNISRNTTIKGPLILYIRTSKSRFHKQTRIVRLPERIRVRVCPQDPCPASFEPAPGQSPAWLLPLLLRWLRLLEFSAIHPI